jgi:hypothetical protein
MGLRGGVALGMLVLAGCGPIVGNDGGGETGSSGGHDPSDPATTIATSVSGTSPTTTTDPTTTATTNPTTTDTTTTATSGTETTTGCDDSDPCECCNFICPGCDEYEGSETGPWDCDLYEQDCPLGEKCMPWANDGGNIWNARRCSPVDDGPGQIGDACTVEGSGWSGIDDCDVGLMCLWVDATTNTGTCVQLCSGSEADPTCDDPSALCSIEFGGDLPVCLPTCDPLLQNCPAGGGCFIGTGDFFVCGDAIEPTIGLDAPCDLQWTCAPGSTCVAAELLPACGGAGCCTAYCDTTLPEPCGPERVCNPVFDGSIAGYCAAP